MFTLEISSDDHPPKKSIALALIRNKTLKKLSFFDSVVLFHLWNKISAPTKEKHFMHKDAHHIIYNRKKSQLAKHLNTARWINKLANIPWKEH